jgi:hypothetical protein
MADNNKDASTDEKTPTDPVEVAKDNLQSQKISGILRAVLDVPPLENTGDKNCATHGTWMSPWEWGYCSR